MRLRRGEGSIVSVEGPLVEHLLAQGYTEVPARTAKILPAPEPQPAVGSKEDKPAKSRARRG